MCEVYRQLLTLESAGVVFSVGADCQVLVVVPSDLDDGRRQLLDDMRQTRRDDVLNILRERQRWARACRSCRICGAD